MKKTLITLFSALALMSFKPVADSTWTVDGAHSKLGFSVSHMAISEVDGTFKKFSATIKTTKDDFSDAVVELTADVNTIDTENDRRNEHLKNPDFFEVAKYPTLTFKSTSFKKVDAKNYKVTGNLTMHGVTKAITLDATFGGQFTNPQNNKTIAGFKVSGTFNRKDFGIGAKTPSAVVGEEVTLVAKTEFIKG
ncbi:YceI family protein [Mucilaginibacter myungsuensis]|uniref:YceI family protein n=1 Tax=Mucilaginibacter myungsuensis TaxID=649104 RepID=A0A929KYM0_9SPHI|nr:YceI family protein [Mucilaginibacter myungsuensis]MBE9663567.1 YceI family protein [Mucilaginibacter myungsuensis]MDN3599109.1 YceI family protein [Mucilaginibacter myungsuensis]